MWSKRASVKSGVEELVGPAVVMGMGLRSTWGDGWENPNCVFIEGVAGWDFYFFFDCVFFVFVFLGRQGSGKAPLEDQRHSQKCPEGNIIQRSGRKKQARTEQKTKKRNTNSSLK